MELYRSVNFLSLPQSIFYNQCIL